MFSVIWRAALLCARNEPYSNCRRRVVDKMTKNADMKATDNWVWRCGAKLFSTPCPLDWESLARTQSPDVRHCQVCQRDVHLCTSPEQFVEFAKRKVCVAIPAGLHIPDGSHPKKLMLGMPPPWSYSLEEAARQWWQQIEQIAPELGNQLHDEMLALKHRPVFHGESNPPSDET